MHKFTFDYLNKCSPNRRKFNSFNNETAIVKYCLNSQFEPHVVVLKGRRLVAPGSCQLVKFLQIEAPAIGTPVESFFLNYQPVNKVYNNFNLTSFTAVFHFHIGIPLQMGSSVFSWLGLKLQKEKNQPRQTEENQGNQTNSI